MATVGLLAAIAADYAADGKIVEVMPPDAVVEERDSPLADPFETMTPDARSSLPLIELSLSRKDVSHFEYLYSRLSDDEQ